VRPDDITMTDLGGAHWRKVARVAEQHAPAIACSSKQRTAGDVGSRANQSATGAVSGDVTASVCPRGPVSVPSG